MVDEARLCLFLQQVPELFFMPEAVFLRHIVESAILQPPPPPAALPGEPSAEAGEGTSAADAADDAQGQGDDVEATLAALAESMMMVDKPSGAQVALQGLPALAGPAPEAADGFFSFTQFGPSAAEPSAKRRRIDTAAAAAAAVAMQPGVAVASWGGDAASWATEGAAVLVRNLLQADVPDVEGTVVRATGSTCTVRIHIAGGGGATVERDVPLPSLVPVAPTVGATVKVLVGDRQGCLGELVGLAGDKGVVQIGRMFYETLPMSHLVVMAAVVE